MADRERRLRVFISWSGERSRAVAETLRSWIPLLIDEAEIWLSSRDMSNGRRWAVELSEILEVSDFGVLVLTPENLNARWLLFEAGALARSLRDAYVVPYLVGLQAHELDGPISQFHAVHADHEGTRRLVETIFKASGSTASPDVIHRRFEKFWAEIEPVLTKAQTSEFAEDAPPISARERTITALQQQVTELASLVRQLVITAPKPAGEPVAAADMKLLEGSWVSSDGRTHMYVRFMGDRIAAPYSFDGNTQLDSAFFAWQELGDRMFAQFRWFNEPMRGFAFFRFLDRDTLQGNWWLTKEGDLPPAGVLSEAGGVPITLRRSTSATLPRWAKRYFESGAPDPEPHPFG